jgi:Flp pilus assembly protein TadD
MKCLLLAACLGFAGTAHAVCNGPQDMVAKMRAHPTGENAAQLGNWYANHRQFACAAETFRAGLKADAGSAQLHYLLGLALAAQKQPEAAVAELQRAEDIDPQALKPHLLLGSLYDEKEEPAEAEREWRKALTIDPKSEQALEGLTGNLVRRQEYAPVVQLLQQAPRTENLSIELARALSALNYAHDAEEVLKEALAEHPGSVPLQRAMVVVLVKQRNYEGAIKVAKSVMAAHPDNFDAALDTLRLTVLHEHLDEAAALGPKLLAKRPKDPELLFLNGIIQRGLGDLAKAKAYLEESVTLEPDFVDSRYELGSTLVVLKEWAEAKQQLEKSIELGETNPEVHFVLAKAMRGLGDNERAAEETRKYQELKRADEQRLEAADSAAQGDGALKADDVKTAIAHYREAIEGQPRNAAYHFKLAIALNQSGDTTGARQELEKAIELNPGQAGPQNALGYLLTQAGDAEGAVKHFQAAVQAAPGWPEAWINLAAELAATRRFSEARQAVGKALELDPENQQAKELKEQLARDPAAQQNHP